jgi:hypothetical protein
MIESYRKRPMAIEAVRYDGTNAEELAVWGVSIQYLGQASIIFDGVAQVRKVANAGDYIIRDSEGWFSPCKPDIFHATYEPVQP